MRSRFPRKVLLLSMGIFAIIGAITVIIFIASRPQPFPDIEPEKNIVPIPFGEEPTERADLESLGGWSIVRGWPSIGGIIVNTHVSSVELDWLGLSRFEASPRSTIADEEDTFCRRLRRTGAKWWSSYSDFEEAMDARMRPISANEREALLLGWPENGGVWVMRADNWYDLGVAPGSWRLSNAHTMEERCRAMEMSGAIFYANPEDYEPVKALLGGFGEHEREPEDKYYYSFGDQFGRF
ncbi:hypothetical protein LSUE1_G002189 [Lachnellula suecica]|uniref:Uncharacterized protein n=1 Tax=Lachnellula suecica TaxID=602035 RepID=A0A8T9CG36_9HELO|nr:hypothetical protein LSUE1_G002189 [Lachnellula suecica]